MSGLPFFQSSSLLMYLGKQGRVFGSVTLTWEKQVERLTPGWAQSWLLESLGE